MIQSQSQQIHSLIGNFMMEEFIGRRLAEKLEKRENARRVFGTADREDIPGLDRANKRFMLLDRIALTGYAGNIRGLAGTLCI
jgi:hypothetical protein